MVEKMISDSSLAKVSVIDDRGQSLRPLLSQEIKKVESLDVNKRAVVKKCLSSDTEQYVVELMSGEEVCAYKAAGCLHELGLGDKVMVNLGSGDDNFITLLLRKGTGTTQSLDFRGITDINADRLTLKANSYTLKSAHSLLSGDSLQIQQKQIVSQSVSYKVSAREVSTIAVSVELDAKNLKQNLQRSEKTVLGKDRVRALNIDYSAKTSARINADTTIVNGKNLLKMDAKLIMAG